jgi:hypothetical protein
MTIIVTKPELNIRDELSRLDKPSGIAGEALLRANTPQEQFNLIGAGRKNRIINGNFDIWQRGTSFTNNTITKYTADRWQVYGASTSTLDITRQSFAAGQTDVDGNPKYFIRLDNTPDADITWIELFQRIEDVTYFSNITVTLSFWIKANRNISGNDFFAFIQNFGSGGSTSVNTSSSTFNISTYWEKKTLTVNLPSISGKTVGSSSYLEVHLLQNSGVTADTYYDIAQVQFETGSVATPFEHRLYGQELALCQRYYYKSDSGYRQAGQSYATNNSVDGMRVPYNFPVTMRANPTTSISGGTDGGSSSSIEIINDSEDFAIINLRSTNSSTSVWWQGATITADAEL